MLGCEVRPFWVPGHSEVMGIEVEDSNSKLTLTYVKIDINVPREKTEYRSKIKEGFVRERYDQWEKEEGDIILVYNLQLGSQV